MIIHHCKNNKKFVILKNFTFKVLLRMKFIKPTKISYLCQVRSSPAGESTTEKTFRFTHYILEL